jgi:hypothetical protein
MRFGHCDAITTIRDDDQQPHFGHLELLISIILSAITKINRARSGTVTGLFTKSKHAFLVFIRPLKTDVFIFIFNSN